MYFRYFALSRKWFLLFAFESQRERKNLDITMHYGLISEIQLFKLFQYLELLNDKLGSRWEIAMC